MLNRVANCGVPKESFDRESIFLPEINPITPSDSCSFIAAPSIKIEASAMPTDWGFNSATRLLTLLPVVTLVNTTVAVERVPVDQFAAVPAVNKPPVATPVNPFAVLIAAYPWPAVMLANAAATCSLVAPDAPAVNVRPAMVIVCSFSNAVNTTEFDSVTGLTPLVVVIAARATEVPVFAKSVTFVADVLVNTTVEVERVPDDHPVAVPAVNRPPVEVPVNALAVFIAVYNCPSVMLAKAVAT
jgi:hypothetical protein